MSSWTRPHSKKKTRTDNTDDTLSFELWCDIHKERSPQFRFWHMMLSLELVIFLLIRSFRDANFSLYCQALSESGLSQSTLSRTMPAVWDRIIRMSSRYNKFPCNAVDQARIKTQFAAEVGFPNVIGAINCTHIAIKAPSHDKYAYVSIFIRSMYRSSVIRA